MDLVRAHENHGGRLASIAGWLRARFASRAHTVRTLADAPALLTTPEYLGTLAAARCLGAHGVDVVVASSGMLAPARWSRAASRVVHAPSPFDPEAMLAWLYQFGVREPGHVLHPTSDEMAWLIARNADVLSLVYSLYTPSFDAMRALLDKASLHRAALAVGLRVPEAHFPDDERDVERVVRDGKSWVVKPRTQVYYASHLKGEIVSGPEDAVAAWRAYRRWTHAPQVRAELPDVEKPLLQELVDVRSGVYSITGFATREGHVVAARAARKVLQRPRGVGIGVCFAAEALDEPLLQKLGQLARHVGFFGAFEAELVGDDRRLIDFNPRYYGQMGFDVARGAPLPWLLQLGALGLDDAIETEADEHVSREPSAYEDGVARRMMHARPLGGATVDATFKADDPLPALASVVSMLSGAARHPRGFLRSLRAARPG
jgi:D-aspartate ligase